MASDIKQTVTPYPLTRAQALTELSTGKIMEGRAYKITDIGDRGIILTGIMTKDNFLPDGPRLSKEGIRFMLVPKTYAIGVFSTITWLGTWKSTNTPAVGNVCIWGGLVWINASGANGTATNDTTLSAADWTAISKSAISASTYYVEQSFGVSYDLQNDWIEKQWDDKGNIMGISYSEKTHIYGFAFNPVDITDWNMDTATNVVFANNSAIGVYNNYVQEIYSSSSSSYITGVIQNNHIPGIIARNLSNIARNTCNGSITENTTPTINDNSNNGNIGQNICPKTITFNKNNGSILKNECTSVDANSNNSSISENKNNKQIHFNSNDGVISSNSINVGDIAFNTNAGFIANNTNTGDITHNDNNGDIRNNSHLGSITHNQNNGDIAGVTSAVAVLVFNNINNGTIGTLGPYIANIADAVVNK